MIAVLFKIIKNFFLGIFVLILVIIILQYVVNAKYTFPNPHSFKGDYIYNPYRNVDKNKWRMANFHAHPGKFFGNRKKTAITVHYIDSLYKYLGYSIFSISDYQRINLHENINEWFVPVYEHGFQYYKNHQLVLNAKKVNWQDFSFYQTLSNKQFIIDQLKKDPSVLITIVHPIYRKAYSFNDFKFLGNYNSLEIANHERTFTSCYDTILSEGHPVFLMADDDGHEITNIKDVCSSYNLINTDLVRDSVLKALRTGRSIGVKFNISSFNTNEEKRTALKKLPGIFSITFTNDTLAVSLNKSVKTIKFIGQQGREKKRISNCSTGAYIFSNDDTYIRTEIECNDGTVYFLNPCFRYNGVTLSDYTPIYNILKTWSWRSGFFIILIVTSIILYKKRTNV
jgi:hypothetical protein